ncbi:DNA polymerase subunit gamma-1, mitochondrial [Copidosoma floridanum]|uniref:DNA polymerase subunit gamma-1, mitochondrial n=1 Tax=Copidosoma floridanum TaxID=29053 RepID=UPI0006C94A04|nr:DNA polymerase subunit gamma-1, mitochondrial [Copidosoma floridanum]
MFWIHRLPKRHGSIYNLKNYSQLNTKNKVSDVSQHKVRYNEINLQMLPKKLYEHIFGMDIDKKNYQSNDVLLIKEELAKFGLNAERTPEIPEVNVSLPSLQGHNIEDHFRNIAQDQVQPYQVAISQLLNKDLPAIPKNFVFKEGWTRYTESGPETVEFPLENGLVFDVEVCVKDGPLPVLATAVSPFAWYSWVSKHLVEEIHNTSFMKKTLKTDLLIPLESLKSNNDTYLSKFQLTPKIVVGHNVSFDRIRVREQYWLTKSATRFLDTMALHISVSGTSSYQRLLLKSKRSKQNDDNLHSLSSLNNLADVYRLYCGEILDKSKRDIFINGNLNEIKKNFHDSILYCALDVVATYKVLKKVYPIFEKRFPHPATLAGMLELGLAYLPVNRNWLRYLKEAETTYEDLQRESKICLSKKADQECRLLIAKEYTTDPWMWDEDWTTRNLNMKKGYKKVFNNQCKVCNDCTKNDTSVNLGNKLNYLKDTKNYLPKRIPHMAGYPNWYRKLCQKPERNSNTFPKVQNISTSMQITPKILNLTWENYPLHYVKEQGWGFLIPHTPNKNTKLPLKQISTLKHLNNSFLLSSSFNEDSSLLVGIKSNYSLNANLDECCYFFKLPHKNGDHFNVGNPLAKDFINKFSENILAGADTSATRVLNISKVCSYWKNHRDRIISQLVVWCNIISSNSNCQQRHYPYHDPFSSNHSYSCNEDSKKLGSKQIFDLGAIIPQVVVAGTLTRRAVEPAWMTASNASSERIGSELRAMINAPPGYSIVGADVDSQELWIASVIGDASAAGPKIQGATPFSWMTLIGNKVQGTDMHSMTAKAIGISRDQAKIINYARIYGAGRIFAERLLKQFNPTISDKEASSKARKMFSLTKGQKLYRLNVVSRQLVEKQYQLQLYTARESFQLAQLLNKPRNELFERPRWVGGSESIMFNSLEEIAGGSRPATPFLNSRLSRALELDSDDKNLPTKINWVVQSSAVDFLHLTLVCMRWLMKDKISLCLTFHDEVRYIVPDAYKYNAALAMHVTNLLVRCFFVSKLKMKDLPASIAFYTSVEVDSVLRKEATHDCATPSNPHGLKEGYGVENGESLDIWAAIDKSKGWVGLFAPTCN